MSYKCCHHEALAYTAEEYGQYSFENRSSTHRMCTCVIKAGWMVLMHKILEEELAVAGSVCCHSFCVNRPISAKHS